MLIRQEGPNDIDQIRAVQAEAFRSPEMGREEIPVEAPLVDDLRADQRAWVPALSLVAVSEEGLVLGHVVSSRAWVGEEERPVLGLGPIGVVPDHQGRGVGSELVLASIDRANGLEEPLIALLGSPGYYRRFGFVRSTEHGIDPPEPAWAEHFQVLPLLAHDPSIRGVFRYAQAFG